MKQAQPTPGFDTCEDCGRPLQIKGCSRCGVCMNSRQSKYVWHDFKPPDWKRGFVLRMANYPDEEGGDE